MAGNNTGIPVVTIPDTGPILARPRKEAVYDTEGYNAGTASAAKITVFRDSTRFANSSLGLAKKNPRDTNMDAQVGLAKGQHLHWYFTKLKYRTIAANKYASVYLTNLDEVRRLREVSWFSFYFGTTGKGLLFSCQCWQIPDGVGVPMPNTSYNATNVIAPTAQALSRDNVYDVTMNNVPVDITEEEVFTADIETNGVTVTPTTNDVYVSGVLGGYFLRGIQ